MSIQNKSQKKDPKLSMIESINSDTPIEVLKEVDKTKDPELITQPKEEITISKKKLINAEDENDISKVDYKLNDILKKKPSEETKPIPVPASIHSKISQLSEVSDFNMMDITFSFLDFCLENHKEEILKLIKSKIKAW